MAVRTGNYRNKQRLPDADQQNECNGVLYKATDVSGNTHRRVIIKEFDQGTTQTEINNEIESIKKLDKIRLEKDKDIAYYIKHHLRRYFPNVPIDGNKSLPQIILQFNNLLTGRIRDQSVIVRQQPMNDNELRYLEALKNEQEYFGNLQYQKYSFCAREYVRDYFDANGVRIGIVLSNVDQTQVCPGTRETSDGPPGLSKGCPLQGAVESSKSGDTYCFEKFLGAGSFGTVWKAKRNGRDQVAIKVYKASPSQLRRFEAREIKHEIQLLKELCSTCKQYSGCLSQGWLSSNCNEFCFRSKFRQLYQNDLYKL